jgi:two-component system KDP operon response regulator KdpE
MRLLVVDDDKEILESITLAFGVDWPEATVIGAQSGAEALKKVVTESPNVMLLDINLPDTDGFTVLKRVREIADLPVLMVSARGEETDRVRGLDLGADDYVTKPFSYRELSSRVRAVLRRAQSLPPVSGAGHFEAGDIKIDYATHEVTLGGEPVKLTPIEYKLLYQLTRNAGKVLLHDQLLTKIWGPEYLGEMDYLRIYIRRLREKLEQNPQQPTHILTERGIGYKFAP